MRTGGFFLLGLGLAVYAVGFLLGQPNEERTHKSFRWSRLFSSAALVGAALLWWGEGRAVYAALLLGGMACSFLGDLIMARVLPLPKYVVFGMAAFGAAHILYIIGYLAAARTLGLAPVGAWAGGAAVGLLLAPLLWWGLVRNPRADPMLNYGSLGYSMLLGGMAGVALGLAVQEIRFALPAAGAFLFLASDLILGMELLRHKVWFPVGDAVWTLYILGQAMIVSLAALG